MAKQQRFFVPLRIQPKIFNMKKTFKILSFFVFAILVLILKPAFAAVTPTDSIPQAQVDELKTKIASKVATLKLVEKRGIVGTVTDSSDTQITLTDVSGNTRLVDVDEITKFSSPNSDTFGISDVRKGTLLGILGIYNKDSKRILARRVSSLSPYPKIIFGGVSNVDSKKFEITVIKKDQQKIIAEVEDITKTYIYAGDSLQKSGFSKIAEKNTVIIIGFSDKQDADKILASRIIVLPNIDVSSRINFSAPTNDAIPSTGSGLKLVPIKK